MIHTNDPAHRITMLKMGYSLEDIRHAHVDEVHTHGEHVFLTFDNNI